MLSCIVYGFSPLNEQNTDRNSPHRRSKTVAAAEKAGPESGYLHTTTSTDCVVTTEDKSADISQPDIDRTSPCDVPLGENDRVGLITFALIQEILRV